MNQSNDSTQFEALDRVISVRVKNEFRRKRSTRRDQSGDSTDTESSSSDIFYIFNRNNQTSAQPATSSPLQNVHPGPKGQSSSESTYRRPLPYTRHNNLDTRPLSMRERLHLARIHYGTIPNCIRLATVLACCSLFVYYSETIVEDYTHFDTLIYFANLKPTWTTLPAVTICSHCVLCMFKNDSIENISVKKLMENQQIWKLTKSNSSNFENDYLNDSKVVCVFHNSTVKSPYEKWFKCHEIVKPVISMQEGHKCTTYFSDIYGEMSRVNRTKPELVQMKFDYTPEIKLYVKGAFLKSIKAQSHSTPSVKESIQGDGKGFWTNIDYQTGNAYTGLYVAIHDPTVLPDMFYLGFHRLEQDRDLLIPFVKRVEKLQPPPYQTKCFHYKNIMEESPNFEEPDTVTSRKAMTSSGLRPYRSRGECFLYCMWRMLNTGRCANFYSTYTEELVMSESLHTKMTLEQLNSKHKFDNFTEALEQMAKTNETKYSKTFCPKSNEAYFEYIHSKETCLDKCPRGCLVETFNDDEVLATPPRYESEIMVTIKWAIKPVLNVVHHPKLSRSEFLGTLGGHAHIWLGISVIHVIRYIAQMVQSRHFLPMAGCCDMIQWWRFWFGKHNR